MHHFVTAAISWITAGLVGVVATRAVREAALRYNLLDASTSSRKIHVTPIPRVGGVAIAAAFLVAILMALVVDEELAARVAEHWISMLLLVAGAITLLGAGVYDDVKGVRARTKLAAQILAAVALYFAGFEISAITLVPGTSIALGALSPLVTVFWVVAVINALNLIDGMDGLAGGVAVIAMIAGALLSVIHGYWMTCIILASLAGATLAFLVFNFHPASIFMGDTGSMFLGAVLAVGTVRAARTPDGIEVLVPLLLLGLPLLDTTLAFARRLLLGRSPFSADKDHLHHRLMLRFGFSQRRTVLTLYAVGVAFALLAIAVDFASSRQAVAVWLLAVGFALMVVWRTGYLDSVTRFMHARRKNARLKEVVRDIRASLRVADAPDEVWSALQPLCKALGASKFEMHVGTSNTHAVWQHSGLAAEGSPVIAQAPLRVGGRGHGKLVAVWRDGRSDVDRDEELALEALAMYAEHALARCAAEETPTPVVAMPAAAAVSDGPRRASG